MLYCGASAADAIYKTNKERSAATVHASRRWCGSGATPSFLPVLHRHECLCHFALGNAGVDPARACGRERGRRSLWQQGAAGAGQGEREDDGRA